jgi:pimeloyl-ACP methyl ester carboxylesterase
MNASGLTALNQLDEFIRETGPYDALFAFSEGAGLAASLLVRRARLNGSYIAAAGVGVGHVAGGVGGPGADLPLIKCAIFFSAGVPRDPETGRLMDAAVDGEVIDVPTAHIWGKNDNLYPSFGPVLSRLCKADMKEVYVHEGGHTIPGARDMEAVKNCVSVIRKTTELATIFA